MEKGITFVGMDAHKVAIKLAVLMAGDSKPVEWQLANEKAAVRRMVRKVRRLRLGCSAFQGRIDKDTNSLHLFL